MSLPEAANLVAKRIRALLDEAERYGIAGDASSEDAFALAETQRRYLPETLQAYEAIPPALRGIPDANGKSPDDLLIEQLQILERATAQRVERVGESRRGGLSANGRFLNERFGSLESLPEVAPELAASAGDSALSKRFADGIAVGAAESIVASGYLAKHFIQGIAKNSRQAPDMIAVVAERFLRELPALVTVERGFLGMGAIRSVAVLVPLRGGESFRYVLGIGWGKQIEATCAKIVRSVTIRTESVDFDVWVHSLFEDLRTFSETQQHGQEILDNLLKG